ncbi:MAG: SDR family oxidoreductase [Rhodospirillaceae bacterium]|nr:SDR family oxidoreductase [Rhodospirillaceae bacterium]
MKIDLSAHRAIVSGSTDGIGFAIAVGLARAGAAVVVNGRSDDSTKAAAERVQQLVPGAKVSAVAGDLSSSEGADNFIAQSGDADILINNVGMFAYTPFETTTDAEWTKFFETNVMSGVRLSRHYLSSMLKKNWGRIIFISSESALNIGLNLTTYSMTKTAQLAVSRGLAEMTAGTGVTVNSVLPGPTRTRALDGLVRAKSKELGVSEAEFERNFVTQIRPSTLLKRLSSPEEVANLVVYVASEQASSTNGASLRVDGGIVRTVA